MRWTLAVSVAITLIMPAGCQDVGEPLTFRASGERWAGTFEIKTENSLGELSILTGPISFAFVDTFYTYTGEAEWSYYITGTIPSGGRYRLNDRGRYRRINGSVSLEDDANRRMVAWAPSLYLSGNFTYQIEGVTLTMRQAMRGRSSVLVLQREY